MTLLEVKELLQAELLTQNVDISNDVLSVCASDLMSDVLAFHSSKTLILTGLTNQQTIRTVEIADAVGVVFVRGKRPENEIIEFALKKQIPLMTTNYCMYDASGLLYSKGLRGVTEQVRIFHKRND
jgi:predicted transcriptional regulator